MPLVKPGVYLAALFCASLQGQSRDIACDGMMLPEYHSPDPSQCSPAALERPSSAGVISAGTLAHKLPKIALQEFDRGVRAWRKGHSDEAVRHLAEAVRLDPNFVDAQNELGFIYVKTRHAERALDYFARALEIEPDGAALYANKASALVMLNRPQEAELAARRAVQLDPGSIEGNYMLGVAMAMQDKFTPEAAAHLAVAADKYPTACAYLAAVLAELAKSQGAPPPAGKCRTPLLRNPAPATEPVGPAGAQVK